MGNESSSNKAERHAVHGDQLKKDFPVLTATFLEHATRDVDDKKYLTEDDITNRLFAKIPDFGSAFFQKYHNGNCLDLMKFLNIGSQFSTQGLNSSAENILKFYIQIFSSDGRTLNGNEITQFFRVCMQSSLAISKLSEFNLDFDKIVLSFIASSLGSNEDSITIEEFCHYMNQFVPCCTRDLHDHVVYRLLKRTNVKKNIAGKQQEGADEADLYKVCANNESSVKTSGMWLVSSLVPISFVPSSEIGTVSIFSRVLESNGWHVLYESNKQGLSANGFTSKVLGYPGSTLTYFRFGGHLLLLGLDVEWRESPSKRGGYDCFLYQLLPEFKIILGAAGECVHFNLTSRTIKRGIIISRDKRDIFELDSDFSVINYEMKTFSLSRLEVWGCGGSVNYEKYVGLKQWEKRDTAKHQNRKLRPDDWKDNPDRVLLDYGGVETNHAKRGDL